jgi:hypothetical protein
MSHLKRRQFLQFAGFALATMGISQLDSYAKALSQNTPRKLALLVGINKYQNGIPLLGGCLNDKALEDV